MFGYLKYFAAVSCLVILFLASLVGWYFKTVAGDDIKIIVESSSSNLIQGFTNTVWNKHFKILHQLPKNKNVKWKDKERFKEFSDAALQYFKEIPVAQLNIYTPDGDLILAKNTVEITTKGEANIFDITGTNKQDAITARHLAEMGRVSSAIVPNAIFRTPEGSMKNGSLIRTFIPILSERHEGYSQIPQVEAIAEVYYDITEQSSRLVRFQIIGTVGILAIFIALLAALIITSRKAEVIITKQHEANIKLVESTSKAETENQAKSQFLANISHELRTPLNSIIGFSEVVKDEIMGPIGNEQYKEYINDIHSSGSHLLSLINDILDYSKAEAGKLELALSDIDATKAVKTCLRLVESKAEESGVIFVQRIPKEHFILHTDAKKLKQVLLNLLSNAIKFTPAGKKIKVSLWHDLTRDLTVIEIKDEGIGMSPKDIPKALSPFGQVDSEISRQYEGTGLGLPLTKKFVEFMGGKFHMESELGVGTTIRVKLPKDAPQKHAKKGAYQSKES